MVSDMIDYKSLYIDSQVLILVLMEYGLWLAYKFRAAGSDTVLILVLMEYGLWPVTTEQVGSVNGS